MATTADTPIAPVVPPQRHQLSHHRMPHVRAPTVASVTLLLMAGCGTGVSTQVSSVPGVDANTAPIALRNLLIPYRADGDPAGSDVPLVVRLFSTVGQPVELSQVVPATAGGDRPDGPRRRAPAASTGTPPAPGAPSRREPAAGTAVWAVSGRRGHHRTRDLQLNVAGALHVQHRSLRPGRHTDDAADLPGDRAVAVLGNAVSNMTYPRAAH